MLDGTPAFEPAGGVPPMAVVSASTEACKVTLESFEFLLRTHQRLFRLRLCTGPTRVACFLQ